MSRKRKFYATNFIDPRIIFLKKKILTLHVMKTHIQKLNKKSKWKGRKMCARTVNGSGQFSY